MASVKDVEAKVAKLKARRERVEARIAEAEPRARAAVIEGKVLNGKVPELVGLRFELETLADEIRSVEGDELPAARAAEAEAERQRHLATARRIHETRSAKAARLDAALAAAEQALADLLDAQRGYERVMDAAGQRQRTPHWQDLVRRVVWEQSPEIAGLLGVSRVTRTHASTMAEVVGRLAPPAEADPLEMPGPTPANKLVPVGSRSPLLSGAKRLASALLGPREGYSPSGPDAGRVAEKARKHEAQQRERDEVLAAVHRGEDVSHLVLAAPGPAPNTDNKLVPPRGDVPWSGDGRNPDAQLSRAEERREAKRLKRERMARGALDASMPVKNIHDMPEGATQG